MSEGTLSDITQALKLAVFQRDEAGALRLVGRAPEWLSALWPQVPEADRELRPESSPFLENFLVDAETCWRGAGSHRASSGPWVELDGRGQEYSLQATAFTAAGRATLLIEEIGPAYAERTSILQKAHEAALAYEKLQRAEQALEEQKSLLEKRVLERTAELSQANVALQEEIVTRRRYADRLQSVREIEKAILSAQSPVAIAETALRRLQALLPCEHASVVELDPESGRAIILASLDESQFSNADRWNLSSGQLKEVQVLKSGRSHRIRGTVNLFGPPTGDSSSAGPVWPLIVDMPLIVEQTLVGVLNLATRAPAGFTREHEEIAEEIAAQLALVIRQARLFAQISSGREQLRALSLRLVEVQEKERRFLARELHDEVGQVLTGLKMVLDQSLPLAPEPLRERLNVGVNMTNDLLGRMRQLSLDLRPQMLDDLGLLVALEWHFQRFTKQTGIEVDFRHAPVPERLPTHLETALYRIAQEALTNVARHAKVTEVAVRLWVDDERAGIQVEDKGAGFDADAAVEARASTGLSGMQERAELIGGEFTIESKPGKGTRLTVELPRKNESGAQP